MERTVERASWPDLAEFVVFVRPILIRGRSDLLLESFRRLDDQVKRPTNRLDDHAYQAIITTFQESSQLTLSGTISRFLINAHNSGSNRSKCTFESISKTVDDVPWFLNVFILPLVYVVGIIRKNEQSFGQVV